MVDATAQKAVAQGSDRFRAVCAYVGELVRKNFPKAEEGLLYKMPGWQIAVPEKMVLSRRGTMDPTKMFVLLKEGKTGITLHVWDPLDYNALEGHRRNLEAAGLEVMVGCVRWSRKSDYPIKEIEEVVRGMKARLNPRRS